jgi:cell division protein FtsA
MHKDKLVVGLDIGTTKICAIVGRQNEFGKLEILGMGKAVSEGVIRGMVTNINTTVSAITKAVKEAEDQAGINIKVVNVGIAGQHIKSSMHHGSITRNSNEEEISVEDINRLTNDMYKTVMPFGSEIIHVMPQDYTVDYEPGIKDPVGMVGVRLEADFHVITAQTNAISNINKCVLRAGLEIENLVLEPLASAIAVLSDEEKEAGVVLVDIGGGTTDVAIFHDNIIRHTAVIPFGGNILTQDIKQGCSVMQKQAELLKVKFGKAFAEEASPNEMIAIPGIHNRAPKEISVKNLSHIIQARMEEIIELVHSEIIFSGYEDKLAAGIVLTGGGSQLQNLQQLFEYMTGKPVRIGHPNQHLGKSRLEAVKSPMYSTAVGLVLTGFRAIDDRETRYMEYENNNKNKTASAPKKEKTGGHMLKMMTSRLKDLLTDDLVDDKTDY